MWAEINSERKKVACGPCIRGHRSSKCDHRDRVLIEVRKPGRPLSSCPHPTGSCSCERVVINYTIPKTSECACPSEQAQPAASASAPAPANRVHKTRTRKSSINPASLEKAIKANQDAETDSSSFITRTPTNPSIAPSDKSVSNGASPLSSASSTPRLLPSPSRKQSLSVDARSADNSSSLSTPSTSSCCQPKGRQSESEHAPREQGGSCCSSKAKEDPMPMPAQKSSCCGGLSSPPQLDVYAQPDRQSNMGQSFTQFEPIQQPPKFQGQPLDSMYPNLNYTAPVHMGMTIPFGFNTPIYNHMASGYQQPQPSHYQGAPHAGHQGAEHNCHCGDGCSCFGCAAHPNNATMTEYIRLMHQYMSTGGFGPLPPPSYDIPSYPHHPGFGAEATPNIAFKPTPPPAAFGPYNAPPMGFQANMNVTMSIPDTPLNALSRWQQTASTPTPASVPNPPNQDANLSQNTNRAQRTSVEIKPEYPALSPIVADSPNDGKDEDTPTLSPSSYLWSELVLPGCNDATGTCQCGDGCECVGCLTHGGHNGVPLTSASVGEQESFDGFMTNNDLCGSDSNMIVDTFSEAPT